MQPKPIKLQPLKLFAFALPILILVGCKKPDATEIQLPNVSSALSSTTSTCDTTICEDCAFQETIEHDTTEYITILGGTYLNPYSIQNMTQAYNIVYGTNLQSVSTTHYYVKFKPQTEQDFNALDSLDLELYDYPLDRVVLQDGDYWPDGYTNLGQNEYPWLYTVVQSNFQFPPGISYQIIAPLNIPDNDPAWEDEAELLTGNLECGTTFTKAELPKTDSNQQKSSKIVPTTAEDCPPGYYWDPILRRCVRNNPPPPPNDLIPQGMITYNTYNDEGILPTSAPVKYIRIVAKRGLKIDKTYTDANGNFQLSKRFPHKVTIVVKFKTSSTYGNHSISRLARDGYWKPQWLNKKNIGTYKGKNLRNLHYEF